MIESREHAAVVDEWLASQSDRCASASGVGAVLLEALRLIWARTRTMLGDVTLSAIFNRVLATKRSELPELERIALAVTATFTITLDGDKLEGGDRDALLAATRALLVETLAVLGRLTGETLTPALHAALAPRTDRTTP
jgi:hypothetical protein